MRKIKKFLVKSLILLVVFLAGVFGTALFMNYSSADNRADLSLASLPEVMVDLNGTLVNRMCGYRQEMQTDFMRDHLTILDTSKEVNAVIVPYGNEISEMSYEIRTSDGSKVLENKSIKQFREDGEYLRASFQIQSSLLLNQEYSLVITLNTQEEEIYYYTRVIQRSQTSIDQYLDFAGQFYEKSMDKAGAQELLSYLETNENLTNSNLHEINIEAPISQISWNSMEPQITRKAVPEINEINENTGSISVSYQISAQDTEGNTEVYEVTDFYRMRYADGRVKLLDFKRTTNQVFDGDLPVISSNGILLGIRDKNIEYANSEDGNITAFVQMGDLWTYSADSDKLIKVFSFRKEQESDFRDARDEHDIKIIRVDNSGDVDFVLYGYMNRGEHEGYEGVGVYHYNCAQNVVEEKAFIPVTESYEFLKQDINKLCYLNEENQLFLFLGGNLYQINSTDGTSEIIQEDMGAGTLYVSDTNGHGAWQKEGEESLITEINFDTLQTRTLEAKEGKVFKIFGYMNEDLIYGITSNENVVEVSPQEEIFAAETLRIEGFDGTVKKEYVQEGLYITNAAISATLLELELSQKNGGGFEKVKTDNIVNNQKAVSQSAQMELVTTERRGTLVRLKPEEKPASQETLVTASKMRETDNKKLINIDSTNPDTPVYYVYTKGGLSGIYLDPAKAIQSADEGGGVVLSRGQQYVWERGNKKTKIIMNAAELPQAILAAPLDEKQLQESLEGQEQVMNLTGCTLDSILYQVSNQRPVIAASGEGKSVVIVGYDQYNTYLYYPETGETKPYGMNDSTELFQKAGNIFISYM